jgi:hypothetical protein
MKKTPEMENEVPLKTMNTPYVLGDIVYSKAAAEEGFLAKGVVVGVNFHMSHPPQFNVDWIGGGVPKFGPYDSYDLLPNVLMALDMIIVHHDKTLRQFQEKREEILRRGNDDEGSADKQGDEEGRD